VKALSKKNLPSDLLEQATNIQNAWSRIDEKLIIGTLTVATLANSLNDLQQVESDLVKLEHQLMALRKERDDLQRSTWNHVKRVRATIKGLYGDDSLQYQMAGGTRLSDRKSPRRTSTASS
jgi:hypothetical protein